MGVDVIWTVLRVVLDDEDRELVPHLAFRYRLYDLADRRVVRRNLRLGSKRAGCGSLRMVLPEAHHHEIRNAVLAVHLLEFFDKLLAPPEVAHSRLLVGEIVPSEGLAQDRSQAAPAGVAERE